MSTATIPELDVVYPESDGKPMADNTLQWQWRAMIVEEPREQYAGQAVLVAGDLLWYPSEGEPRIHAAPDAMVAFGRPDGHRSSYLQWKEADIAPQVVFEVLSPSNSDEELDDKLALRNPTVNCSSSVSPAALSKAAGIESNASPRSSANSGSIRRACSVHARP